MADATCPPLGTGSVDFNALHAAALAGADLSAAIEQATTKIEPAPESAAEAEAEQAPAPAKAVKAAKADD